MMSEEGSSGSIVVPPPPPGKTFDYPVMVALVSGILAIAIVLFLAERLDKTHGPLTISIMILLIFLGSIVWGMRYTIPADPETASLVGGLVTALGAVIAYWLGGHRSD